MLNTTFPDITDYVLILQMKLGYQRLNINTELTAQR